jgi:hypothetical protein
MSLDFQQVNHQIREMGKSAPERERRLQDLREEARRLLFSWARDVDALREKVELVVRQYEPTLRCARPVHEQLDAAFPAQKSPKGATIIAADGSQINLDRHAEVQYGLVNVGAICMTLGAMDAPETRVKSQLIYDERLDTLTEATLALMRDLGERSMLLEMAKEASPPVITFTDGPVELWGARSIEREAATEYQRNLVEYLRLLRTERIGVTTAGYVDKPAANLVVRLLGSGCTNDFRICGTTALRGVLILSVCRLLGVGERSAVFALQSQTEGSYEGVLALHFFYLNVGRENYPYIARVDIPAWVAGDTARLDDLQAVLVEQCRTMGGVTTLFAHRRDGAR